MVKAFANYSRRLMCHGAACTPTELKEFKQNNVQIDTTWKGENPDHLQTGDCKVEHALHDMHNLSGLCLVEFITLCSEYKDIAIRIKCSRSLKDWRAFCLVQLSKGGARILHRFVDRQNAPQPVAMFKKICLWT